MNENAPRTPNVEILQFQIEALNSANRDIRKSVQDISEAVGVLRIIEVRAEQQKTDSQALTKTVQSLHQLMQEIRSELLDKINSSASDTSSRMDTLEETVDKNELGWVGKYNRVMGIVTGVGLLSGALSGLALYNVQSVLKKLEYDHEYVLQLRALDADTKLKYIPLRPAAPAAASPQPASTEAAQQ